MAGEHAVVMSHAVLCRLPIWHDVCDDAKLWKKALADIVKTRDGSQRTPLMNGVGAATFVNDITEEELLASVADLKEQARSHPVSYMHMSQKEVPGVPVNEVVQEAVPQPAMLV